MSDGLLYSQPPICTEAKIDFDVHPWMDVAARELGEREVPGSKANKRIQEYLKGVGINGDDEIPWCSAFVNWCLRQCDYAVTGMANARSWLRYGVPLEKPRYGCVCVFWRDYIDSEKGHVGFYLRDSGLADIRVLSGNQGNQVCGANYPRIRLLGYRWPVPARG